MCAAWSCSPPIAASVEGAWNSALLVGLEGSVRPVLDAGEDVGSCRGVAIGAISTTAEGMQRARQNQIMSRCLMPLGKIVYY